MELNGIISICQTDRPTLCHEYFLHFYFNFYILYIFFKSTTSVNYQQTSNTTLSNAREQMTETLQAPL